jgi:hypothetical protein
MNDGAIDDLNEKLTGPVRTLQIIVVALLSFRIPHLRIPDWHLA